MEISEKIARDYQDEAVLCLRKYFGKIPDGNVVLEVPTGAGKSYIQAVFIHWFLASYINTRVLCLSHVKELIMQNHDELMEFWPDADAGIFSASLNRRDQSNRVIFATIQSVRRRAEDLGRFDVVMIDECHMVSPKGTTMYRQLIDDLREINPDLRVMGMTATPYRLDNGMLTHGDDALFDDLISAKKINAELSRLIELGHLSQMAVPSDALPSFDVTGIGKSGGDFKKGELARAIEAQWQITQQACDAIVRLGADRECWIVFGTSVEHCERIERCLSFDHDIPCAVVVGATPKQERADAIDDLKSGKLRALISVNVLSTGFNVRQVDLLAMMRPTASTSLYVQQAGRGMRAYPGKTDCLVLDFAGNIGRHGPLDNVKVPKPPRKGKGGEAPEKECPECLMLIPISVSVCPFCDHQIVEQVEKIEAEPSRLTILGNPEPVEYKPTKAVYHVHKKAGKPDSLRVSYYIGLRPVGTQWVCLAHGGRAQMMAAMWWRNFVSEDLPESVNDAVYLAQQSARLPSSILVDESGRFPMVKEARL